MALENEWLTLTPYIRGLMTPSHRQRNQVTAARYQVRVALNVSPDYVIASSMEVDDMRNLIFRNPSGEAIAIYETWKSVRRIELDTPAAQKQENEHGTGV